MQIFQNIIEKVNWLVVILKSFPEFLIVDAGLSLLHPITNGFHVVLNPTGLVIDDFCENYLDQEHKMLDNKYENYHFDEIETWNRAFQHVRREDDNICRYEHANE